MKRVCVLLLVMAAVVSAGEPWKLALDIKGNLSWSWYSDDWADEAAVNSLTWSLRADGSAEKQIGPKLNSKTTLKLEFGQTTTFEDTPFKSADLIDLESVLKMTLGGWVDPYLSFRAESKFADMSHEHTRFFNPIALSEGLGAMRVLVKKETLVWDARFAIAAKHHIDRWAPANDWETQSTTDGGTELVSQFSVGPLKDMLTVKSTFRMFDAFARDEVSELDTAHYWSYPDINWETSLTLSLTKYIMLGYTYELAYEREHDANAQHRQLASLGISLNSIRPKPEPEPAPAPAAAPAEEAPAPAEEAPAAPAAE